MSPGWIAVASLAGLALGLPIAWFILRRKPVPVGPTPAMVHAEVKADVAGAAVVAVATDPGAGLEAARLLAQEQARVAKFNRKALAAEALRQAREGCYTGEDEPAPKPAKEK